jgi:hypothetical protein
MTEKNARSLASELTWWIVIGLVILGCVGLFAVYAPRTRPVVQPVVTESGP